MKLALSTRIPEGTCWLGYSTAHQIPANASPGRQQVTARLAVAGSLSPMSETWMQFQVPIFDLVSHGCCWAFGAYTSEWKKISFHLYLCSFLSAFQIKQNFKFNKIYIRKQKEKPLAHCNHQNLLHMHHVLNNQPKDSQRSRTLWRRHLRCICLTSLAGNRSSPFLLQQDNTSSYAISKVTDKNEGSVAKNVVCVWMHILIRWSEQSNYF